MAEISGKIYLIIGGAVGALSLTLNLIRNDTSMTLFAIIGVGMFLWGLFYVIKQKKESHKLHDKHLMGKNHPAKNHSNHVHNKKKNHVRNIHPDRFCPKCGNKLKSFDNFCSNCGFRMR